MSVGSPRESLLSQKELDSSLDFLVSLQSSSGMIPWFKGGRADPWNHTEAAIALALGGRLSDARAGARWLLRMQNNDGSWCHFYLSNGVAEPRRESNTCSFPVLLVAILDRLGGSRGLLSPYVEMALRGLDYVISHQRDDGSLPWAIDPRGDGYPTSLVAASSSICDSLAVAEDLCERYGIGDCARYKDARQKLSESLSQSAGPYADTSGWAMDHYYPLLGGVEGWTSLSEGFLGRFYVPDWGVRCMLGREWFTAAETAETAMALHISGDEALAQDLYMALQRFRRPGGGYLTGMVGPQGITFPHDEQSSYSVAAVIISSFLLPSKAGLSIGRSMLSLFS